MVKIRKPKKDNKEVISVENPEVIQEGLTRAEDFITKNKNLLYLATGIILVLFISFTGFNFIKDNQNSEAQEEMFQAVYYFESDSIGLALNGDGNNYGFLDIISLYSGTDAANLSNFYVGAIYLRLKDFNNSIRYLKKFSSQDFLLQARAFALIGDAYMELNDFEKASKYFKKASMHNSNKNFSPYYLNKYALALELKGDLNEAIIAHEIIINDYRTSVLFQESQKEKARLEGLIVE